MVTEVITIRPTANIYSSVSSNDPSYWGKTWDNVQNTTHSVIGAPISGQWRSWVFALKGNDIPAGVMLKRMRVRAKMCNVNDSGTLEVAFGTATDITYNATDARTRVTEYTGVSNYFTRTEYEMTTPWYTLSDSEAAAISAATNKTMYLRLYKGQTVINEIYVDVEYEKAGVPVYVGTKQIEAVYVGTKLVQEIYVGTKRI